MIIISEKKEDKKVDNRKVKCPYCEKQLYRRDAIQHTNRRYYHEGCFNAWRNETDARGVLIDYIMELYGLKKPTGMILMQIKRFHEEFGYSYKGMELTLRYFHEILGNEIHSTSGIGIIPYVYEDATEQYKQQLEINKSFKNYSEDNAQTVYITPKIERKSKRYKNIDIETL